MPIFKEHPVPFVVKRASHWITMLMLPSVALLSAGYGNAWTALLVVMLGLSAIASAWTVTTWDEMVHITAEDGMAHLTALPVRVASGILVVAACLLHDGWLGVALACAAMLDLVVSEVLYVQAGE